jgi:hypothetical protein
MNTKGFVICGLFALCFNVSANVPQLIDLKLVGPKEGASFEPKNIELNEGESYIFVIENPYDYPYTFVSATLPNSIRTQYIQGSPAVTKTSVQISPHTIVKWVFSATKGGQHQFNAQSYGLQAHKDEPGTIKIVPLLPVAQLEKSNMRNGEPLDIKVPSFDYLASMEDKQAEPMPENNKPAFKPRWGGRRS